MSKTLEGMARADWERHYDTTYEEGCENKGTWERGMRAALLWLANNVSDEMVGAYLQCKPTNPRNIHNAIRESIAAALRDAAGSATPEVK